MSTEPKFGAVDLAQSLAEARFSFLQLASALLNADPLVAGWNQQTIQRATELGARGARLVLELSTNEAGSTKVALIAVQAGERTEIGAVSEIARGRGEVAR